MRVVDFRAMNTLVQLAIESQREAETSLQQAQAFIEECEQRFSRFLPDSELSRLNAAAGSWAAVSDDLLELLILSKAYYRETGGLFDPSILPDLKRAGYDASLEQVQGRSDTELAAPERVAHPTLISLEIDAANNRVRLPEGMQIDLGGIAKGWIVQRAAGLLKANGSAAAVNAGGDMYFAGSPSHGEGWQVEIESPLDPAETAARLRVGEGAVVTSSVSKRTWRRAGESRHHIIDPRTGEPARSEWLSATVIAPHADLAEAYAKAFLMADRREATRLMLQRPHIAVLCIDPDGRIHASPNARDYLNVDASLL